MLKDKSLEQNVLMMVSDFQRLLLMKTYRPFLEGTVGPPQAFGFAL